MNGNENITNEVKKKKTPGILIPILLVVLLIIVLEVIYYVVLSKPKTNDNKKEEETEEKIDYSPYLNTTKDITRNGKKTDIYKYSYLEYDSIRKKGNSFFLLDQKYLLTLATDSFS